MIGIYKITNKINGKCYIGQSTNIPNRIKDHRTPSRLKRNTVLARALSKYGPENFSFEVIELCSKDMLDKREMFYIRHYNSEYNMNDGGRGNVGHSLSDEVRNRLAQAARKQWENLTPEQKSQVIKNNLKGPSKGHEVLPSTREKLRRASLGKKQSLETIRKRAHGISQSMTGNQNGNKAVYQVDPLTNQIIKEYPSTKAAALAMGVNTTCVTGVLKGRRKTTGGYKWIYK